MSGRSTARVPRPARERGRKRLDTMAYSRALADLRERHRDEFDELRARHFDALYWGEEGERDDQ